MPPQRPNLVLTSHIPHIKLDILIRHALHVEADGRDRRHVLAQLELVQDGGLAGGVEPEHEEAHFFGSEDLAHYFGELATHFVDLFFASLFLPFFVLFACSLLLNRYGIVRCRMFVVLSSCPPRNNCWRRDPGAPKVESKPHTAKLNARRGATAGPPQPPPLPPLELQLQLQLRPAQTTAQPTSSLDCSFSEISSLHILSLITGDNFSTPHNTH